MTDRKNLCFVSLLLAIIFFLAPEAWPQAVSSTRAPTITNSFAVEKGKYGYIWKIYIEAEDPDGDMLKIASVVDQVGYGLYPANFTNLKPQYRQHLKGYVQWNTFSSKTFRLREWTQITLRLSIIDKAGNESNVMIFPFTFEDGVADQYRYKVPTPFDEQDPRLGYIYIDLFEPTEMGGGGPGSVR